MGVPQLGSAFFAAHLSGHVKEQGSVWRGYLTNGPAQFCEQAFAFSLGGPIWKFSEPWSGISGWIFSLVQQLVQRDFQGACKFF